MIKLECFILTGMLFLGLCGCQSPKGPRFDPRAATMEESAAPTNFTTLDLSTNRNPEWLKPPIEPFTVGPGDRLSIEILGDPTSQITTSVGPDGRIYFQLLPGVDVWGLTLPQIKARLEKELLTYMREAPQVSVALRGVESQRFWIMGRLNAPGVYNMSAPTTLLEALVQAGGPASFSSAVSASGSSFHTELADLRRSFVLRQGQPLPVDFYRLMRDGDMSQNIYLRPDDFVYIPSKTINEVFVLGAVYQPKTVAFEQGISLVAAIASARGTIKDAYLSHVAVVRGSLTKPRIAILDYNSIVKGKQPDAPLESGDIIYVPYSPYRTLTRYLNLITSTFVQTVAINEGTRAVTPGGIPVGVNIGVGGGASAPAPTIAPTQ